MTIELEQIINHLGQPIKQCGDELIWKCPYCEDKSQNNLIYNKVKNIIWCFASGGEHSKQILRDINQKSDKKYTKTNTYTKPIKKILSPDMIKQFTNNMHKFNNELLNTPKAIKYIEEKRGIKFDTVKDCFIGINREKKSFAFPTLEFMTNNVIGFEYRPYNLSKKGLHREKGGITGLAQINQFTDKTQVLAILGGYLDCYVFHQYLKEIGQVDFYHIATSSNGEGSTLKYLEDMQEHFNKYKKIYLYLDTDKTGIEQMEHIKDKFPFVEMKTMTCGCKDFNDHYLKCIKSKINMLETDTSKVSKPVDIKPYTNLLELNTSHSDDLKEYKINPQTYKLIIDNKIYDIPRFFNIKGAIEGNYKALDYIFSYFGLDIKGFRVQRE